MDKTSTKDFISALPTEILYDILSNLCLYDRMSFRNSNLCEFGALVNKSVRDDLAHDEDNIIPAICEAAAKGDEKMVRRLCEKGSGYAIRTDRYWWHSGWNIYNKDDDEKSKGFEEEENPGFFVLGQKPDDETVDTILSIGSNLVMCKDLNPSSYKMHPLHFESAIGWSLENCLPRVQGFIRMGANPELLTEMEYIASSFRSRTAFDIVDSTRYVGSEYPRRTLYQGIANNLFHYNPIEDIDDTYLWRGNTLLHMAVLCSNSVKMVRAVLARGFDINALNDNGETPLTLAFHHIETPLKLIKVLLENGADTSVTPYHQMAEVLVFAKHHHEKLAVFLRVMANDYHGGDGRGSDGDTLLHLAIMCGMPIKHIKYLLKRGLDVNIKNSDGKTALDCTQRWTNDETPMVRRLLKGYGAVEIIEDSRENEERRYAGIFVNRESNVNLYPPVSEELICSDGW